MVNSNPGFLTTLSATPNTRIVDGTDNIHSGIINALNVATGGNAVISGFNITQEDGGTYTQYDVATGKILRDGILVSVSARSDIAPGVGARADNDWYATVVVDSSNVIQIRTGGSGVSTASVSTLTASDIPVAIIKYPAGTDHDAVDRPVQFLGYNGSTRGLSILNSGSETLRINANATLTKGSATLTLPSSTGTIALTSDITYTSAISEGNSGLIPSGGVGTSNIANDAVTYAKMQNVSGTDKILGRDSSGAGIVEEMTPANVRTMLGIETGATADQSDAEIETAYHNQVAQVSSAERTAGNSTSIKRYTPADIKSMIDTHQTDTNTDVTVANLKTKLNSDFGGDFTIGTQSNDTAILSGHLTVGGNLTVNGATQTINSTVVTIDDPVFTLGGDSAGTNDDKDRGIEFKWHDGANPKVGFFGFDDSVGKFTFIPDSTNSSEVFSGTAGTIVANLEGAVTGNASTATALATSRNFSITGDVTAGAIGFTGAGNVALSTTLADDAVATAKIADDAVTSAKIADATIATGNLADDSVTFAKMQDTSTNNRVLGATTAGTIGEVQVATAMVADDAITSAKIADDAVGADQLASNAVVNASVASNAAIAQSKIDGLVSALSGKEPSQTIGDGLDRTSATLKVDIDGLTIENGIDRTADFIMYDDATNGLRRINPANLFGLLIASDVPDISSAYRATGTALVNADISNSAAISADKIADGSTNKVFTATLKSKLDGVAASATAGADWSSNVSNISVANSQLAGSIANAKLANSSVTINSNSLNLGGTLTLDTDDFAEGTNKFYTDERVDDRVNALITDGEGITTTYNDSSNTLTLAAELATTSNKGVASFTSDMFDVSSGIVSLKNGAVKNAQIASDATIAQSKIQNLTTNLASKVEDLGDLSITASAAEINILDGVTGVSATEIGYLDGVTSAIQTQLNSKLSSVAVADLTDINSLSTSINTNSTHTQLATAKAVKDYITQQQVEDRTYTISATLDGGSTPFLKISDQFGGSSTVAVTGGDRITTTVISDRLHISDSGKGAVASASFNEGLLTLTHDDGTTTTATVPDSTTDAHGLMTDDQFDKLAAIEAQADVTDKANVVASLGLLNESDTLYLGDAGNDTTVRVRGNFFVDGTTTTINQTEINVQDAIKFEGQTADDHETILRIIDPTADRVISLPDITGTVVTTGDSQTIATGMIANLGVTTGKIASNAVSSGKLATGAVATAKIADDAVTGAKIDFIDDSIAATDTHIMVADGTDYNNVAMSGDATLANDGVLTIANLAVETGMLANLGVTTAKIAADAITGAKIADDAINSEHYTNGSIDEAHIADNAVTVSKISGLTSLGSGTVISSAERTKLSGIETSADVTDATNVNAAGAVMHTDIPDSDTGFVKRTGSETYDIDTNTYLTSLAVTGLSDIAQLEQNLASITDDHAGLATAKAVKAYVDSIPGGVGGMSFVLEDGDGTELTVADSKEIKFVPASSLLTINWTDVDNGTDADPYDLTFTVNPLLSAYTNDTNFTTTTALDNATAATAITGKVLTNLGSGTGGAIAAGDTILAAMQKLETRTALNDAKVTNTDVNVNVSNLTARLPQITESVTIGDATDVTVTTSGALVVTGNLTVNGTTTTLDTTNLAIEDKNIVLGTGNSGSEVLDATGLTLEGGSGDDVTFQYNASADRMELKHGSAFEDFKAGTILAAFTGDLTGDVTGNADTATTLAAAVNIAGKSFNGSAAITIATTDLSDISALDTDLSSVSASHDSLATAQAIKTYVDAQVQTEDTIAELNDTNIGSLSAGHLLIYDSTAGVFDNAIPTGSDTSTIDMTVTGGDGTLAISADLKDPNSLTEMTDDGASSTRTAATGDQILVWEDDPGAFRKMTLANLSDFAVQNGAGGISTFKTIVVDTDTSTQIVADDTADTLSITSGTGMSIASTAGSDTLTFNVNIDGLTALGGTGLHQTQDHFMFSDNGTEKKITFSNLEDAIFANVSGDATIAAGGALTIAANSVALGTDTTGNYMTDVSAGTGIDVTHTAAEGSTATIAVDVSDFMANGVNNRILTATGTDAMNAEANLLYDGDSLVALGATNDKDVLWVGNTAGNSGSTAGITHLGISHWGSGTYPSTRITATEDAAGSYLGSLSFSTRGAASDSAATERMRITSDGKVGIGTTSPVGNLHISSGTSGDATVIIEADTDNNAEGDTPKLWFKADGGINEGAIILNDNEFDIVSNVSSSGGIRFLTGTTNNTGTTSPLTSASVRMQVTSAGSVGIGITAPDELLHVSGAAAGDSVSLKVTNTDDTDNASVASLHLESQRGTDSNFYLEHDAFGSTKFYTGQGAKNHALTMNADGSTTVEAALTGDSTASFVGSLTMNHAGSDVYADIIGPNNRNLRFVLRDNGDSDSFLFRNAAGTDIMTLARTGDLTVGNDLTVGGDLVVSGTTTTINTATVEVEDNILQLNTTQASPDTATAATSGISVYRGDGVTQASLIFDDGDDTWDLTNHLTVAGTITGNLTGNVTGNVSGTAATVTGAAQTNITSLGTLTALQVDNLNINANTISSTDTNGDITVTPNGTGDIVLDGQKWPQADGSAGQILKTDGNGQLSYVAASTIGGDGISYNGSTANGLLTYGGASTIDVESTLTYDPSGMLKITSTGYGRHEIQGNNGAYIDMKNSDADDFDVRLITDGTGLEITTAGASSPIALRTNNAQRMKIEDAQTTLAHHLSFGTTSNPYIKAGTGGPLAILGDEDGVATSYSNNVPTYSTAASLQLRVNASNQTAMEIQNNKDIKTYGFLKSGSHSDIYGANTFVMGSTGSTIDNDWFEVFRWTPKTDGGSDANNWQYDNFSAKFTCTARGIGRSSFDIYVRGEYGTQDSNGWWTKEFIIDGWDDNVADDDTTFRMVYNAGTNGSNPYASLYQKRDEDWELRHIKLIQCHTNCLFDYFNTNVGETDPTHDTHTGSSNLDPSIRRKLYVDSNEQLINGVTSTGIYLDNEDQELVVKTDTDPLIRVWDTSDNYAATLQAASSGAWLGLGDMDSSDTTWMKFGAFSGTNNLDTKTRDFHLYGTNTATGFYFDESAGTFGIGTTAPSSGSKLDVNDDSTYALIKARGTSTDYLNAGLLLTQKQASGTRGLGVFMHDEHNDNEWFAGRPYGQESYIVAYCDDAASHGNDVADINGNSGNSIVLMTIKDNGNVGIGDNITNPSAKLQVEQTSTTGHGLKVYRNQSASNMDSALVYLHDDSQYTDEAVLHVKQDGTGLAVKVEGALQATTKSFDIEHPTEEGKRLHHGSLEGPEHGVYIRGRLEGDTIELPDYWLGLVDEDTITVQLTPNKGFQQIYVDHIEDNKVYVGTQTDTPIDCFYFIQAERKDVEKMEVEYDVVV